jgi:hypothetical protein
VEIERLERPGGSLKKSCESGRDGSRLHDRPEDSWSTLSILPKKPAGGNP